MRQLQLYGKKVWLYRHVVDFRASIDGLSHIVEGKMKQPVKKEYFYLSTENEINLNAYPGIRREGTLLILIEIRKYPVRGSKQPLCDFTLAKG